MTRFGVVVLAGGAGRRLGGAAKPTLAVGGEPMLARVLAAVDDAAGRVVVGPASLSSIVPAGVRVVQEEPAGGGPVAALAAGLAELVARPVWHAEPTAGRDSAAEAAAGRDSAQPAAGSGSAAETADPAARGAGPGALAHLPNGAELDVVVVLAADLPLLTRDAVGWLLTALVDHDGAVFVDDVGRRQWLCGAWWSAALAERLAVLAATGPLAGRAMRELVAPLRVVGVPVDGEGRPPWYDCDTPADLADAERRLT